MTPLPQPDSSEPNLERMRDVSVLKSNLPKRRAAFNPRRLLAVTLLALIALGTLLLGTPWAQSSGLWFWQTPEGAYDFATAWSHLLDTFFMAVSAACVTGLTLFDLSHYTAFGQTVLLLCIQLGGIGIMTLGTFLMTMLLGRLSVDGESQVMLTSGTDSAGKARQLLNATIRYVLAFEATGAAIFFARYYWGHGYSAADSCWHAVFQAVSAFCNAGFSLHPNNLADLSGDWIYALTTAVLVLLGSLGFLVLANLQQYRFWRRDLRNRGKISLHSRIVLWTTFVLVAVGGLQFTLCEWNAALGANPDDSLWTSLLAGDWLTAWDTFCSYCGKICAGFAQPAMCRTAGFNYIEMARTTQPTQFSNIFFMLIGGSPGSMAGGLKTTTVVVLFLTMRAMIQGNPDIQVHRRTIPGAVSREAMVLVFFYLLMLFLAFFVLLATETAVISQCGELALFYEVVSAFGTVGSSLNVTPLLSPVGRLIICVAMYLGRLGPISVAIIMAGRETTRRIRYPEESVTVG